MIPDLRVYNTEGVQAKIRSRLPSLSRGERRVADYILANPSQVIYQSVTDVGAGTETSEATVIRFCQGMGYRGYHEFKVALAQDLVVPTQPLTSEIQPTDTLETMASKILNNDLQVLQDTMRVLDLGQLEAAVAALVAARKVELFGVGASGVTAMDAKYKFTRIGLLCDACQDTNMQAMAARILTAQDVAIGISYSGANKDTLHAVRMAKDAGAKVVVITNFARSPITEHADIVLLTASRETPMQSGSLASKIAQVFVLELLFVGVAARRWEKAKSANEKAGQAIVERMV